MNAPKRTPLALAPGEMEDRELIQLVLDFAREMNDLQTAFYPRIKQNGANAAQIFSQYQAQADTVYARYLTGRKRSFYYGISHPPFFHGVTDSARFTVEQVKNRWVVEVLIEEVTRDYRFSLVYRGGERRIDSFKQRYHSIGREIVYGWQYGNF